MKALLDTHTFLWWNSDHKKLSDVAKEFVAEPNNQIFLSSASAWEMTIKYQKGRLELPEDPNSYIRNRIAMHRFTPLPVHISHATKIVDLPTFHSDPFDRMLIAQSLVEEIPLITIDSQIKKYDLQTIW